MSQQEKLSRNQKRALAALISQPSMTAAAESLGMNRATITRWLEQPHFRAALESAEGAAIAGAIRRMVADMDHNLDTMRAIRDDSDNPPAVRLRAARAIDTSLLRWRSLISMESRVSRLEELVHEQLQKTNRRY